MINNVAIDHIFQVKTNQDLKLLGYAQICSGSEGVKCVSGIFFVLVSPFHLRQKKFTDLLTSLKTNISENLKPCQITKKVLILWAMFFNWY